MNQYTVTLYSNLKPEGEVFISFLVNTPMTAKQLKTYYEYKSISISKVEVINKVQKLEKRNVLG
jgi:hypothetical protein